MASQLDLYRHSPARLAEAWRAAAEASRKQFPEDEARYRYYADQAKQLERQERER